MPQMTLAQTFAYAPWLLYGSTFLLALAIGSFLNVVIHRLPIMLERQWREQAGETLAAAGSSGIVTAPKAVERYNLVVPRSRCPKCSAEIKAHHNIPVLSWLILGGKCASCGSTCACVRIMCAAAVRTCSTCRSRWI